MRKDLLMFFALLRNVKGMWLWLGALRTYHASKEQSLSSPTMVCGAQAMVSCVNYKSGM